MRFQSFELSPIETQWYKRAVQWMHPEQLHRGRWRRNKNAVLTHANDRLTGPYSSLQTLADGVIHLTLKRRGL